MNLPKLSELDVKGKTVLLRADLDVDAEDEIEDRRLTVLLPTFKYLLERATKITIIAHKGRPAGKDKALSLKPFAEKVASMLKSEVFFEEEGRVVLKENLRFDPREEKNDPIFAQELASLADVYVNEAFAVSHRRHASIVGVAKLLPHAAGFNFAKEVATLSSLRENPQRPLVVILSGAKKDKIDLIEPLSKVADKVLIGGRLPDYLGDKALESVKNQTANGKVVVANLIQDKEDITVNSIERFVSEINKAKTVVLAGVLGKYEDEGHRQGTKRVFEAVASSGAFKIVGGGDSLTAITLYGLEGKFDWISVGGGAMIELLASGTLPGIEALEGRTDWSS